MEYENFKSLPWKELIERAGIKDKTEAELNLNKEELFDIYKDHLSRKKELDGLALYFVQQCLSFSSVHSVRYRVKDSLGLISKIIRKNNLEIPRNINLSNYSSEVTDLVGIRILHLFKQDTFDIDDSIRSNFKLVETELPTIYIRKGDEIESDVNEEKFNIKEHNRGYRSVHYLVQSTPKIKTVTIEIQVRTIFEEGWSEIDHKILYPENTNDTILGRFSSVLNGIAGSSDQLATLINSFIVYRKTVEHTHNKELEIKNAEINDLRKSIAKSNLSRIEKEKFNDAISGIAKNSRLFTFGSETREAMEVLNKIVNDASFSKLRRGSFLTSGDDENDRENNR